MLKMALKTPQMPVQRARRAISVGVAAQVGHAPGERLALGDEAAFRGADQALAVQLDQGGEVGDALVQHRADMPLQVFAQRDQVLVEGPVDVGRQRQAVARVVIAGFAEGVDVRGLHQ